MIRGSGLRGGLVELAGVELVIDADGKSSNFLPE